MKDQLTIRREGRAPIARAIRGQAVWERTRELMIKAARPIEASAISSTTGAGNATLATANRWVIRGARARSRRAIRTRTWAVPSGWGRTVPIDPAKTVSGKTRRKARRGPSARHLR